MPSPITLFTYNRPQHTKKTVEALQKNKLSKESILYVFSDGPKKQEDVIKVKEVREYIKTIKGFKKVLIKESKKNKGLANSIISGVTEVINKYNKVIVLEDDLITSSCFLEYMNEALDFYQDYGRIFTVSGYSYPIKIPVDYNEDVFIDYRSSSYGWGTWKNRWEKIDWDMSDYFEFINDKQLLKAFNRSGTDLTEMLKKQKEGQIDSWAIRRTYSQFRHKCYTLFPRYNLVRNIGVGIDSTHTKNGGKFNKELLQKKYKFKFVKGLKVNKEINRQIRKKNSSNFFVSFFKRMVNASF